jgi:hypothetical protein
MNGISKDLLDNSLKINELSNKSFEIPFILVQKNYTHYYGLIALVIFVKIREFRGNIVLEVEIKP